MKAVEALQDFRRRLITRRTMYRRVFDTDPGKQVLRDLHKFCRMGQDIMVPGDPNATAYNIGRQRVYLRIESIMKMDEDTINNISKEGA